MFSPFIPFIVPFNCVLCSNIPLQYISAKINPTPIQYYYFLKARLNHRKMKSFNFAQFISALILLLISANFPFANSRAMLENGENSSQGDEQNAETAAIVPTAKSGGCCNIYENGQLFALMERICELCQDMIGQNRPNMRAECSADCFRGRTFKKCLRLFKPIIGGSSSLRRANRILKQMAETFAEQRQQNSNE